MNATSLINPDMMSSMQKLLDEELDVFFWPASRAGVMSAWWGHVPFAHWLVATSRPRVIVELGTHNGASFAAFCEAVQRERIPAKCFAVDTWQGDEHAGLYGEEIHADIKQFVEARYGSFADLIRSTFDDAQPYFADASIDLLHIDGLHTYEAVKHDFETWLPKLSRHGVVLFHDINVRERDFGVWQLWSELRRRYGGVEFSHGHGLGVLLVGEDPPAALSQLVHAAETDPRFLHAMHARLSELGRTLIEADRASRYMKHAGQLEKANAHLHHVANEKQQMVDSLQAQQVLQNADELDRRIVEVSARSLEPHPQLTEALVQLDSLNQRGLASHETVEAIKQNMLETEQRIVELTQRIATTEILSENMRPLQVSDQYKSSDKEQSERMAHLEREETLKRQDATIHELSSRLEIAHQESDVLRGDWQTSVATHQTFVEALNRSVSWRLTKPLRALKLRIFLKRLLIDAGGAGDTSIAPSHGLQDASVVAAPKPSTHGLADTISAETSGVDDDADVALIRQSALFDEAFYAGAADAAQAGMSPIAHYLQVGEQHGWAPSADFDPAYYLRRHQDLLCLPQGGLLLHYLRFGRDEGRIGQSVLNHPEMSLDRFDPAKPCMIVAAHEATRTGAAILSWNLAAEFARAYNVVVLLRRGGPIQETFHEVACAVVALPDHTIVQSVDLDILAQRVNDACHPVFMIANSVESRYFVPGFEKLGVPCVALVHEFSSSVRPLGVLSEMFEQTSRIVFSAQIVADSALRDYTTLTARDYTILPQGACKLPTGVDAPVTELLGDGIQERLRNMHGDLASVGKDDFLVVGLGTVTARKGVEFFIAAADRARRLSSSRKIVFAWVGKCYDFDAPYLQGLLEQVERADLARTFFFWGELANLDPVYARADAVFLSSRLDPLPNIGIDASMAGVPVVCFDRASGMSEILGDDPGTASLVVPHLDAAAAAEAIVAMARDKALHASLSTAIQRVAAGRFDMAGYVRRLEALALASSARISRNAADVHFLGQRGHFNAALYAGPALGAQSVQAHIAHYLRASDLILPRNRPRTGLLLRRPLEGFHPMIYAGEAPDYDEYRDGDPLVHFLRAGRPTGRWSHPIIRPSLIAVAATSLRVAIHAHFHYPELFPDFARKMLVNRTPVNLFLTTTSEDKVAELRRMVGEARLPHAQVLHVSNHGRDIGPMLCGLPAEFLGDHDVVGHFHGKRSPHVEEVIGGAWREFLWQHLIGDAHPMMDTIMQAFVDDPRLGLVFAEDPHLNDWDLNRAHADRLAERMGLDPLPAHLDFPQGTMFWARPAALQPMMSMNLSLDEFPMEPLPIDGTLLHALERLLPFAAARMGLGYAATYVESHRR